MLQRFQCLLLFTLAILLWQVPVSGAATVPPSSPSSTTAQLRGSGRCPEGHPQTGDIGIEYLLCAGGSCSVNLRTDRGYVHDFSTEPSIREIRPGSPAAGKLRNGDVLIAIDGVLITTREGGRRLANLTPGVPVTLRLRRDGREMNVTVVRSSAAICRASLCWAARGEPAARRLSKPRPRCSPKGLRRPGPLRRSKVLPTVDFGMELECGDCGCTIPPVGRHGAPRNTRSCTPSSPADPRTRPASVRGTCCSSWTGC